jgi:hypothetical protein
MEGYLPKFQMNKTMIVANRPRLSNLGSINIEIDRALRYVKSTRIKFDVLAKRVVYNMILNGCITTSLDQHVHNALIDGIHTTKWLNEDHMGIMRTVDIQQALPVTPIKGNNKANPIFTWNADSLQWETDGHAIPTFKPKKVEPMVAINDHVCKTCKETRVSKTERLCWRCGYAL